MFPNFSAECFTANIPMLGHSCHDTAVNGRQVSAEEKLPQMPSGSPLVASPKALVQLTMGLPSGVVLPALHTGVHIPRL